MDTTFLFSVELICGFVNKWKRNLEAVQGLSRSGRIMDPEVSSKVYWSVCIPSMLYGAEVLDLSKTQMGKLETAHKQITRVYLRHSNTSPVGLGVIGIICRKEMLWAYWWSCGFTEQSPHYTIQNLELKSSKSHNVSWENPGECDVHFNHLWSTMSNQWRTFQFVLGGN